MGEAGPHLESTLSLSWARQHIPGGSVDPPPQDRFFAPPGPFFSPRAGNSNTTPGRNPAGRAPAGRYLEDSMTKPTRIVTAMFLAAFFLLATPPATAQKKSVEIPAETIDINSADVEELMELPGIGQSYAQRIVEYRQEHGAFERIEDLMNVRGIGEKTFLKIRGSLRVGKSSR